MTTRRFIVYLGANGKPQIDKLASGVDAWAAACGTVPQFAYPVSVAALTCENGQLFPDGTIFTDQREPVAWVDSKMLDRERPQMVPGSEQS